MTDKIFLAVTNKNFNELNPLDAGYEKCEKEHSFGPAIREYWLIHYVKSGCGTFEKCGKTFNVSAGEAFLICPDEVCTYTADLNTPWEYIWIAFNGKYAEKFETLGEVFKADAEIFDAIIQAENYSGCMSEFLAGQLFLLYTSLFSNKKEKISYVKQACGYIETNYINDIKVCDIAKIIGVERTYLAKIFKKEKKMCMQDYLIDVRINKAEKFLKMGYSVKESAYMSGYSDVCNFSKMFKRKKGIAPKEIKATQ